MCSIDFAWGLRRDTSGPDMKHLQTSKIGAVLAGALMLSACVGSGEQYPSLAVRDAERVSGAFNPAIGTRSAPVTDPALLAGLPAIEARAQTAYDEFVAAVPGAQRALSAAQGASASSNAWAAAQISLADLDSQRSQTAIALADIDLIYAEASIELAMAFEIAELRAKIDAQVSAQDQILDQLRQMIR